MKTLDEVIFEAPYTMTPWEENAIYYLKEYRDHMKNEIIELQEEVKKQKEMIEFLEKPLTWDELCTMEGKPVWIEGPFITEGPHWIIVGPSHLYNGKIVGYGKTWQAYRKEMS